MELRVIGQHVAVNIKNPNRSVVHNHGPQLQSTFLPWTGVLKGGLGSIRGVVLGHLARTKMLGSQNNLGWHVLYWKMWWSWCIWFILCLLSGTLVRSLLCSRVVQICRTTVRTCNFISLRKSRMEDDKKDQRQKPRHGSSGARRGRSGGRGDSGWRNRGRGSVRNSSSSSSSSPALLGGNVGRNSRRSRRRRKCWRSMIHSSSSWKRRPRRKRGPGSKRRCWPRSMKAQFPCGNKCAKFTRVPLEQVRQLFHTEMTSSKLLVEQIWGSQFVAASGEFMTVNGSGAAIPRGKEARSGLVFDIARK